MTDSTVRVGDCRDVMRAMDAQSVDAIVTDPPYGLEFMGKGWDRGIPGVEFWTEALRVLKPGGHLLAFGGTRTFHRLTCAIEDAGFEIRDCLSWLYGSGFPKSLDVSKAIDKAAGVDVGSDERWVPTPHPVTGAMKTATGSSEKVGQARPGLRCLYRPSSDNAQRWHGWGTALKPAWEPIILARKPLASGTVAANVLEHGCGALNVDGCRIEGGERPLIPPDRGRATGSTFRGGIDGSLHGSSAAGTTAIGRWPANVALDEEAAEQLDAQTGVLTSGRGAIKRESASDRGGNTGAALGAESWPAGSVMVTHGDRGGASRFFFTGKATRAERKAFNKHPTVKPVSLMRWLVRLVTPAGGLVLDPFTGSGTTGVACRWEGFRFVGIEQSEEYAEIARARIDNEEPEHGEGAERRASQGMIW